MRKSPRYARACRAMDELTKAMVDLTFHQSSGHCPEPYNPEAHQLLCNRAAYLLQCLNCVGLTKVEVEFFPSDAPNVALPTDPQVRGFHITPLPEGQRFPTAGSRGAKDMQRDYREGVPLGRYTDEGKVLTANETRQLVRTGNWPPKKAKAAA